MKGIYQTNYKEHGLSRKGREVLVIDDGNSYAYDLADGDTLQDVADSFRQTANYDHTVECRAEQYEDGKQLNTFMFTIEPQTRGAGLTECLNCGADITNNTHPNAVPDFCDTRCESAYYDGE